MAMSISELSTRMNDYLQQEPLNYITAEDAIRPSLAGLRLFDSAIFGVAQADSPDFELFRRPYVVGPETLLPSDWIPEAKSVISFFMAFDDQVKRSNQQDPIEPSDEWLHARIEGQDMVAAFGKHLESLIKDAGHQAVYAAAGPRFKRLGPFLSNWSERHVAYACGLGTFGLSRGLITRKGMAGRFGSVITDAVFEPTPHDYNGPFDYCIMCGVCERNCPVGAIDASLGVEGGKNHETCVPHVGKNRIAETGSRKIRYGCGKCQVGVPCQDGIPNARWKNDK